MFMIIIMIFTFHTHNIIEIVPIFLRNIIIIVVFYIDYLSYF